MRKFHVTTICGLLILLSGCTARNKQTDYYRGGAPQMIPRRSNSVPQNDGSNYSPPVLQAPGASGTGASETGASETGGPMLLSPEPLPDSQTRRKRQLRVQTVRSDPWGRPQNRTPRVRTTIRRQVQQQPLWRNQFQSSGRRPIQTVQIGIGNLRVLVLASLRGTDPASITVVDHLAQAMHDRAELQNSCTALLIRNPNPDGLAKRSPYNGRGIDLNRNFPANNWRRTADATAGPKAASETETRMIVRTIDDFKPDRIIIIQVSKSGNAVHYAGPARQLARKIAAENGFRDVKKIAERPGSPASFIGGDRRLPLISILVDRQLDGRSAWNANAPGLIAALTNERPLSLEATENEQSPQKLHPVAKNKSYSLPLNSIGGTGRANENSRRLVAPRPDRRGFFELPPPRQEP